jgi:hypothetical protein
MEAHAIEARLVVRLCERCVGHAYIKEIRPEASDELLEKDLEDRGQNDSPCGADDGVAGVPGRFDADLGEDVDETRSSQRDDARCPRGNDPAAIWICPVGEDNIARLVKGDGKGSSYEGGDRGVVELDYCFVSIMLVSMEQGLTPRVAPPTTAIVTRSIQFKRSHCAAKALTCCIARVERRGD